MKTIVILAVILLICTSWLTATSLYYNIQCIELKKSNRQLTKQVIKLTKENERLLKVEDRFSKHLFNETFKVEIKNLPRDWNSPPKYKGVK